MKINEFIWNNYRQTGQGKQSIKLFAEGRTEEILSKFGRNLPFDIQATARYIYELINFCTKPKLPETLSQTEASSFFKQVADQGISLVYDEGEPEIYNPKDYLGDISLFSTWLYFKYPKVFKPYFFVNRFSQLNRIADTFGLLLPSVPLKRYKDQRFLYYYQLCEAFSAFQEENDLTPEELCAFLCDFAPNYFAQNQNEAIDLPQPTQA